ncbi:hypothetical protein [Yoonia sediminilitoris]|nr:hypothetical protein [Yoonia sediminilitoris]
MKKFFESEEGAVTVDFVVLTAAMVVLGLLIAGALSRGATDLAGDIEANLTATTIPAGR